MIITGSTAMKYFDKEWRIPSDFDVFYNTNEKPLDIKHDYHYIPDNVYNLLNDYVDDGYLNIEGMYNLKVSHIFFDIKWNKTRNDILSMQEKYGFSSVNRELFDSLYKHWLDVHPNAKNKINLNMPNEKFFTEAVNRKYEHDRLHEIVAYDYGNPIYKKILKYKDKPAVSQDKFNALSPDDKLNLCREETYVIALERFLIPNNLNGSGTLAYTKATKKLLTTMTKGWFPLFYVENLRTLYKPKEDYVKLFKKRIENDY